MIAFSCVGKISNIKETEKFKIKDVKRFSSGWTIKTLNFQVNFGNSRINMQIKNGYFSNPDGTIKAKDNYIYTYIKDGENTVSTKIDYQDRLDPELVKDVVFSKKFVLDTNTINRFVVEAIRDKFGAGSVVDPMDMDKYNIYNLNQANNLLEKINDDRKEYIYAGDFIDDVERLLASDLINNHKFRIYGEYEIRYADSKGTFYKAFVPKRIYMVPDDQKDTAEEKMEMQFDFYFNKEGFDSTDYEELNKCFMRGYVKYYDAQYKNDECKGNVYCPITVALVSSERKYIDGMKKKFSGFDNCQYKCMRLTCNYIDGAEKKEITMDDLSEETRSDIECGLLDFEEVKRQFGGSTYGDRITEIRYSKYDVAFGIQETELIDEDFSSPEHDKKEKKADVSGISVEAGNPKDDEIFEI